MIASLALTALLGASGEPNPYLAQAKVFYQGVDYESCLKRLEQAVRWNNTRQDLVEIEIYWGLCQFEDAQRTAAKHFALALQLDPEVQLPPFTSPKVMDVFKTVAAKMPKPEAPAPPPVSDAPRVVVVTPPPREPAPEVVAPPRPGRRVGPATIAFGAGALAAAGTAVVLGVLAKQSESAANGAAFTSDAASAANQAYAEATGSNVATAVAVGCAVGALVVYFATGPKEEP
jgi:hypothetical protein